MRLRAILLCATAFAAVPASASAAPEFTATMSGTSSVFEWEGSGSGVTDPFGAVITCAEADVHNCQDVLFNVQEAGDLTFTILSDGDQTISEPTGEVGDIATFQDIDTYLYPSNAAGEIAGDSMSEDSASTKGDETFTMKNIQPGYYLLQVEVFLGFEASWTGKAELTNVAPKAPVAVPEVPAAEQPPAPPAAEQPAPAPAPAAQANPPAQPQPATAPKKKASKKASCQKKAKKIKNKGKRKKALKKCAKLKG